MSMKDQHKLDKLQKKIDKYEERIKVFRFSGWRMYYNFLLAGEFFYLCVFLSMCLYTKTFPITLSLGRGLPVLLICAAFSYASMCFVEGLFIYHNRKYRRLVQKLQNKTT